MPKNETYVIRDGDSLGGIARKFGVPRNALLDANNLKDNQPIYIGETLIVPSAPKPANPVTVAQSNNGAVHIVQPGDTLTGIARKYGSTVSDIKVANQLQSDVIGMGQQLAIPNITAPVAQSGAPVSNNNLVSETQLPKQGKYQYENNLLNASETYGYYQVKNGDNLYALARDFFTTLVELQRLNKLGSSTVIHTGDELVVPTSKYNAYHNNMAGR